MTEEIKKLFDLLESSPLPGGHEDGDYAELVDENDPDGPVRICNKVGREKIIMPRTLWDELRQENNRREMNAFEDAQFVAILDSVEQK